MQRDADSRLRIDLSTPALRQASRGELEEEARRLAMARELYLSGHPGAVDSLRPTVAVAWRRSHAWGVDPDSREVGRFAAPRVDRRLRDATEPVLRHLKDVVAETLAVVILTDCDGVIYRVEGDREVRRLLERVKAVPGADLSEDSCGANAVGTALEVGQGIQMWGPEHYIAGFQPFACTAVPIRDPLAGRLLGVLDVTCRASELTLRVVEIVERAADEIERRLEENLTWQQRALLRAYLEAVRKAGSRGVIASDGDTTIVGRRALELIRAEDYPWLLSQAEVARRKGTACEGAFHSSSGQSLEVVAIPQFAGGEYVGTVFVLRRVRDEQGKGRWAIGGSEGPFSGLVGESVEFRRAVALAAEAARRGGPVYIWGEPGSGRYTLALATAQAMGGPVRAIDCAIEPAKVAIDQRGQPDTILLLRGVDDARPALARPLLALVREGARVVATGKREPYGRLPRGIVGELVRAVGQFCVEVPPLRRRREDVPLLVAHFLERLGIRQRVTVSALQALASYRWPGNLAELQAVLRTAAASARGRDITLADLPAAIVQSARSALLSRYEEEEMKVVLEALRESGGNRSLAAQRLGISRATLHRRLARYRKLGIPVPERVSR